MSEKEEKERPVRVQFGRDESVDAIVDGIRKAQDDWALEHPEKAHDLYPQVYAADGSRIKKKP